MNIKQLRGDHVSESKLLADVQFNMNLLQAVAIEYNFVQLLKKFNTDCGATDEDGDDAVQFSTIVSAENMIEIVKESKLVYLTYRALSLWEKLPK